MLSALLRCSLQNLRDAKLPVRLQDSEIRLSIFI